MLLLLLLLAVHTHSDITHRLLRDISRVTLLQQVLRPTTATNKSHEVDVYVIIIIIISSSYT